MHRRIYPRLVEPTRTAAFVLILFSLFSRYSFAQQSTTQQSSSQQLGDRLAADRQLLESTGRQLDGLEPCDIPLTAPGVNCYRHQNNLYFVCQEIPENRRLTFPRVYAPVKGVVKLSDRVIPGMSLLPSYLPANLLPLTQSPTEWTIEVPEGATLPMMIRVECYEQPLFEHEISPRTVGPDGAIALPAHCAEVHGEKLQYEPLHHKNTVGYWVNASDWCHWSCRSGEQQQKYLVQIYQGCGGGQGGSTINIHVDQEVLQYTVEETGHFQNFVWRNVGPVTLPAEKSFDVAVRVANLARNAVMDIRQIRLVPITEGDVTTETSSTTATRDLRDVVQDVYLPPLLASKPSAGRRVVMTAGESIVPPIVHTLWLPVDWRADVKWPVFVELTGNGGYDNDFGDRCTGSVADASLAMGLTAGQGCIILSVPFLNGDGTTAVSTWWGDKPNYDPSTTIRHLQAVVEQTCQDFNGDPSQVMLVGFSRGSIACNQIGLANDTIAKLWSGFICFSHYDGVRNDWPVADGKAAERLQRLAGRRQLILCEESGGPGTTPNEIESYLAQQNVDGQLTILPTGFRNHSDTWALRPSKARDQVRNWLATSP